MTTTITSKGQVTIPAGIRELIGLHEGDKLDFHIDADGHLKVDVVGGTLADLKGLLPKPARPLSMEEMEEAIGRGGES